MSVVRITYSNYAPRSGTAPSAPTNVTSIAKDSGATVSFLVPASTGSGAITSWTVTPYIGAAAQTPTTVSAGSAGSIIGSNGNTYVQATVSGLTNSTAYTFTVKASNSYGTGPESAASGANTPLSGLIFGDDFNGSVGGDIDPEWWILNRCGDLQGSTPDLSYYLPSQVALDGSSNIKFTAVHTSHTGPRYPSDPLAPGNVTQPWTNGAMQSNTRTYAPSTGNFLTVEVKEQTVPDAGNGFWPGLLWLYGYGALTAWKTDPEAPGTQGWNSTTLAEIDIAEWPPGQASATQYTQSSWTSSSQYTGSVAPGGAYNSGTQFHAYSVKWKPGVSVQFFLDGSLTNTASSNIPASGAAFFMNVWPQILAGGPTTTESCYLDYVRIFDAP